MSEPTRLVIVAVDLSDGSRDTIAWAFDYALRAECDVRLLHVVDHVATSVAELSRQERDAMTRAAEQALERTVPDSDARRRIGTPGRYVVWGKPADQIVRAARRFGADLIVVGTHGRSGWKRARLGSVAEMVVRHAPCTVTCVKPKHTG